MYYLFVLLLQYGWTALHRAAQTNNPEIIKTLIANGADIAAVTKVGTIIICQVVKDHR